MKQRRYIIRSEILDMNHEMWRRFGGNYADGPYKGTAWNFLRVVGLPGGLSARFNNDEREFFTEIYDLWRKHEPEINVKTFGVDS